MSDAYEPPGFEVAVTVAATRDAVWSALTEPALIRRWHGWDSEGLDAEIRFIYVDHATLRPPDRIELDDGLAGQVVELLPAEDEAGGDRCTVTVVRPGPRGGGAVPGGPDEIEEGWRGFLQQLRHALERHPDEERRTVFLAGEAPPAAVRQALVDRLGGVMWHEDDYQCSVATDHYGRGLALLVSARHPLASDQTSPLSLTVTTHRLDDRRFAQAQQELSAWWSTVVGSRPA